MSTPTPSEPQGSTLSGSAAGLAGAPGAPAPADPVTARAAKLLADRLPGAVLESSLSGRHPSLRIAPAHLVEACLLLRDDPDLRMDCLHLLSGVDWPAPTPTAPAGEMEVVYHLVSYARKPDAVTRRSPLKNDAFLVLRVRVPRSAPDVPSVMGVWAGADWHERETWDLLGIRFTGRPPLRRILLPEDWPGHPLRKDWEYPADYHGIPIIPPEGR